jgi:hypothetical protein
MKKNMFLALAATLGLAAACTQAQAWGGPRFVVGVGIGPCWGPGYYGYPYYYGPGPYPYYAPGPVVVQQAPVVVQPAATAQVAPAPQAQVARAASDDSIPPLTPVGYHRPEVARNIQLLSNASEKVRMDGVINLGKMRAVDAVDPVAATMSGDRSPQVREAAARALGLIGSPKALTALKYAAQADDDREVRNSAQFAVEVIQSSMRGR